MPDLFEYALSSWEKLPLEKNFLVARQRPSCLSHDMLPHLFLAPAGRGKTHHCIARIQEVRAKAPLAPIWVILPNQAQVVAFRRRLAEEDGALGVQLGTFYTFYAEILARAGQPIPRLLDPVQHRLLRTIVDRLGEEGRLCHYAPLRDKPGFVRLLRALVRELKRARVHRDDFAAAVADGEERLTELAAIYADYQEWLVRINWMDAEGQGWLAALALEENPHLCRDLWLLIVDGFDEFNPTQLEVLRLLTGHAAETIATLTGDASTGLSTGTFRTRIAHRRFARALAAITTALNVEPESLAPPRSAFCNPLAHLEASLFEPSPQKRPADGAVAFIEAQNRSQEVRAALRWIKARLVRDKMTAHEVAIIARDLAPYRPFLQETAAEFGLPLRLAEGADLLTNPAVAALLSLLSLPVLDWPRRQVVDAWRNPYFDWSGLDADSIGEGDADRLDAAARAGLVIQGLAQWREALDRLVQMKPATEVAAEDEDLAPPEVPAGAEAAALRRKFEAFVARVTPPPEATVRDYAAFVEDLIGDDPKLATRFQSPEDAVENSLGVVARAWEADLTAQRDVAALRAFKDVLRGLVLAESVLGQACPEHGRRACPELVLSRVEGQSRRAALIPYARFYVELRGAVEGMSYTVPPEPNVPTVLAASVLNARGLSFRAVTLLGLSEGEFPQAEREDTLLCESDRLTLRDRGLLIEPRLQGDEVTFFYEAVTRAREKLLLCRPYLADDGQQWEPSPYWEQVRRLIDAPVEHVRPEDPLPAGEAASPQELVSAAAFTGGQSPLAAWLEQEDNELSQAWRSTQMGASVLRARLADEPCGSHEGDLTALADCLSTRYAPRHTWSASRLEAYATCPMLFWVGSSLELEPRILPEEGYDVRILGTMYHRILEELYRRVLDPTDADELLALLPALTREVFDAAPHEYGFRPTPLWDYQRQELEQILANTVIALVEASPGYIPTALEQIFGLEGQPALVIQGDSGELCLRGFIDRIDRGADGRLRVIDYKTGSTPISARDLAEGRRVQLALYALAARDALDMGDVSGGFYWHIGSAKASSLKLEKYKGGVEAALQVAANHALAYAAAVRTGHFQPKPPSGGCPGHCPAAAFCWRYAPRVW
jgi:ATP-dependent helicase/DNAse subunit B